VPDPFAEGRLQTQNDLQRTIHRDHWEERIQLITALASSYYPVLQRTARRMAACAESARLALDPETDTVTPIITRCCNRICPYCTVARTVRAKLQLLAIMTTMANARSVVLTARSSDAPLADQLRKLRAAFRRLRSYKQWRGLVTGGVYTVEITYNHRRAQWHPHVHLIIDGKYVPQKLLSAMWRKATADSDIVWIAAIRDTPTAAMELAGYIGKPPNIRHLDNAKLFEYVLATKGLRMLQTFGLCRSREPLDQDKTHTTPLPAECITLSRLRFLADRGCPDAQHLGELIELRWPMFQGFFTHKTHTQALAINPDHPPSPLVYDPPIKALWQALMSANASGILAVYDLYAPETPWQATKATG
jgi:hypothetical protein